MGQLPQDIKQDKSLLQVQVVPQQVIRHQFQQRKMITTPLLEAELFTRYQVHLAHKVRLILRLDITQDTATQQEIATYLSVNKQDFTTQLEFTTILLVTQLESIIQSLARTPTQDGMQHITNKQVVIMSLLVIKPYMVRVVKLILHLKMWQQVTNQLMVQMQEQALQQQVVVLVLQFQMELIIL